MDERMDYITNYIKVSNIGKESVAAYMAMYCVITNLGEIYNPLFIIDDIGCEKSRLMRATAEWAEEFQYNVKVLSAIELNDIVRKIFLENHKKQKYNWQEALYNEFKFVDIFIINNLEQISEMFTSVEIILDLIDWCIRNDKQVVVTTTMETRRIDAPGIRAMMAKWWCALELRLSKQI